MSVSSNAYIKITDIFCMEKKNKNYHVTRYILHEYLENNITRLLRKIKCPISYYLMQCLSASDPLPFTRASYSPRCVHNKKIFNHFPEFRREGLNP